LTKGSDAVNEEQIEYHTIENWDQVRGGMFKIIVDAWWWVDESCNPLFYSKHNYPQCNQNPGIAKRIANGRNIKQLPVVYVPLRIHDY